jgi:hypothetical protein
MRPLIHQVVEWSFLFIDKIIYVIFKIHLFLVPFFSIFHLFLFLFPQSFGNTFLFNCIPPDIWGQFYIFVGKFNFRYLTMPYIFHLSILMIILTILVFFIDFYETIQVLTICLIILPSVFSLISRFISDRTMIAHLLFVFCLHYFWSIVSLVYVKALKFIFIFLSFFSINFSPVIRVIVFTIKSVYIYLWFLGIKQNSHLRLSLYYSQFTAMYFFF